MSKQLSTEEQIELITKAIEPRVGKRANIKRNLMYVRTALGGTFIPVDEPEIAEEGEVNETNPIL